MVKQKRDIKYDQLSCVCYKQTNEATWRHMIIRSVVFLLQKNKNIELKSSFFLTEAQMLNN